MSKTLINCIILILTFLPSVYAVEDIGVNFIRSPDKVSPGTYETFVISISNYLPDTVNLQADIELPEGWTLVSGPQTYIIPGLKQSKAVYLMSIDKNCTAGRKTIVFNFRDEVKDFSNRAVVYSQVQEHSDLRLQLLNAPNLVQENEAFTISYLLVNHGNIQEQIELISQKGNIVTPKSFTLDVGGSKTISIHRKAELKRSNSSTVNIFTDLEVIRFGGLESIRQSAYVKVVPTSNEEIDPYFRYPISAGIHYMGRKRIGDYEDSYQLSLSGRGYLDMDQNHHLSFLFRGPNQYELSGLGTYDQYSLEYESENIAVTLGDNNYGFSRLLELGRLARGGGLKVKADDWGAGGFFYLPRFNPDIKKIGAGYIERTFGKTAGVKFMGMTKEFRKQGIAQLASVQSQYNTRNIRLLAELSGSILKEEADWAGQLQFSSYHKNLSFHINGMYAGEDFKGFFTNSILANGNINYRINKVQIGGGFNYDVSNPALDTFQIAAPFNKSYFANFNYSISRNATIWFSGNYRSREDRLTPKRFYYEENTLRVRFSNQGLWHKLETNLEWGKTTNFLAPENERVLNSYIANAMANVKTGPYFSFGAFGSYYLTNRYSVEKERIFLFGGNISLHYNNYAHLNITYRNNYLLEEINRDRSIFSANMKVQWAGHQIGAFLNYNLFRNTLDQRDFYFTANYIYTLGVPMAKKQDFATLGGKVVGKSGQNVKNIILKTSGHSVVTDENGHFFFKNLKPGTHYIYIDPTSLDIYDMPAGGSPIKIELGPGEQKEINIPIVTTARLKGNIDYKLPEDVNPPSNLIIKLTGNDETKVTAVNRKGDFTFQRLQPGPWTFEVVKNGWEKKFEIKPDSGKLNLKDGDEFYLNLVLKEKELEIIFKN